MNTHREDLIYRDECFKIVGVLFSVYKELGGSLLEKYYQKALAVNRKSSDAYLGLGILAEEDKLHDQAAIYYKKAQELDPNNPRPYYYLGFIYKNMDKNNAAVLAFRKFLKLDPQSKEKQDIEDEIHFLTQ